MAWLAPVFSSIRARCPKKVRRQDLMTDENGGWLVMRQMSAFLTSTCGTILIKYASNAMNVDCLQCFDAVGWAAGRASGL